MRKKGLTFRILSAYLVFFFMLSFLFPKDLLAGRSNAGGGDVPEFTFADFAMNVGTNLGGMIVGGALSSAFSAGFSGIKDAVLGGADALEAGSGALSGATDTLNVYLDPSIYNPGYIDVGSSFGDFLNTMPLETPSLSSSLSNIPSNMWNGFTGYFTNTSGLGTKLVEGYGRFAVVSQVGRTLGLAGQLAGWSPSTTFIVSSIGTAAAGGFMDPGASSFSRQFLTTDSFMGSSITNVIKSTAVGALEGAARSGIIVAIDGGRINNRQAAGIGAQIAGMAAGYTTETLGNAAFDSAFNPQGVNSSSFETLIPRIAVQSAAIAAAGSINQNLSPLVTSAMAGMGNGIIQGSMSPSGGFNTYDTSVNRNGYVSSATLDQLLKDVRNKQ